MADRRPGPPLFELLAKEQAETKGLGGTHNPELGSKPKLQVELRPMGQGPDEARDAGGDAPGDPGSGPTRSSVTSAERAAALDEPVVEHDQGMIRVSMSRVYLSIAVVLLVMTGVWAVAYNLGVSAGKAELEPLIGDPDSVVVPRRIEPDPAGARRAPGDAEASDPPAPAGPGAAPRGTVLVSGGAMIPDPRRPGTNYLKLGVLGAEQASDALEFFEASGVRLIAQPLDSGPGSGNNPSRYTLYSLGLAVPSGEYRAMKARRDEHQRRIADIGARWQRERRGGSDFSESKTLWVKYE